VEKNTDSGEFSKEAYFKGMEDFEVNNTVLYPELVECRVIKTQKEIELMRYACRISSQAHIEVMKRVRPGMMEYFMEALFQHYVYRIGGCRFCSYSCICCSGRNGFILHYGHQGAPNDKQIEDGDMMMFDMGSEYHCYGADVSCSYPCNGKFTDDQRMIYETVLLSVETVLSKIKPGVNYAAMHRLVDRIICERFKENGLLTGDVDEMMENYIGTIFMPHGLGHFLGIDTHDVGGYPNNLERSPEPGLKSLRIGRELQEGMLLTVEPGLYFNPVILNKAFEDSNKSKFLVKERITDFLNFGGIRLEENIVVTSNGYELLSIVPRKVEEIEKIMAEGRELYTNEFFGE